MKPGRSLWTRGYCGLEKLTIPCVLPNPRFSARAKKDQAKKDVELAEAAAKAVLLETNKAGNGGVGLHGSIFSLLVRSMQSGGQIPPKIKILY